MALLPRFFHFPMAHGQGIIVRRWDEFAGLVIEVEVELARLERLRKRRCYHGRTRLPTSKLYLPRGLIGRSLPSNTSTRSIGQRGGPGNIE